MSRSRWIRIVVATGSLAFLSGTAFSQTTKAATAPVVDKSKAKEPPKSEGKTITAAGKHVEAAFKNASPAAKQAAKALTKEAEKLATGIKQAGTKLDAAAKKADEKVVKALDPKKLIDAVKAAPKGQGAKVLSGAITRAIDDALKEPRKALEAARIEASKLVKNATLQLKDARAKAPGLGADGKKLVAEAERLLLAARVQAGDLLRKAKDRMRAAIAGVLAKGQKSVAAVAGAPKAAVKRVEEKAKQIASAFKTAAVGLKGVAKAAMKTIAAKVEQAARNVRNVVNDTRNKIKEAIKNAVSVTKALVKDTKGLANLIKQNVKQAPKLLAKKGLEVMTKAAQSLRSMMSNAKMGATKLVKDAVAAFKQSKAAAAKLPPEQRKTAVAEAKRVLRLAKREALQVLVRTKQSVKGTLRAEGEATKKVLATAGGKKSSAVSTGLK
jgi:hypothetical protein